MKRFLKPLLIVTIALFHISWGSVGHKTIALIAEHHLTPQAKAGIKALLGDESLADVSNWADEVKRDSQYKMTDTWHYLNVPTGLTRPQFEDELKDLHKANVYTSIERSAHVLAHDNNSKQMRIDALKFLIHLVGDAHQPMHVSRAEDKGGNTIQVQFDGRGTNLHSVWDTKLIDHQNLSYEQMAKEYDTATPQQIKQWQGDNIMKWLWESYQLSSKFYKEVETNNQLGDAYYNEHIGIVKQRIEMAGIRLAVVLNGIFSNEPIPKNDITDLLANTATKGIISIVPLQGIDKSIGNKVQVSGKVYSTKDFGSMVLLNVGKEYPNQLLTVVLRGEAKKIANDLIGKVITVTGTVIDYKGKPEIVITDPETITIHKVSILGRY